MRPLHPALLVLALIAATPSLAAGREAAASGVLLHSCDVRLSGGSIGIASTLSLRFDVREVLAGPSLGVLYGWLYVNASHAGMRFRADASTDPDFPFVAHHLTDGNPDYLGTLVRLSSGNASGGFAFAPDFAGETITHAELVFRSIALLSPGSNPNGDGNWTDWSVDATLELYAADATPTRAETWGRIKALWR